MAARLTLFQAAKKTWALIKDRGITALINECLIGPVLTSGATFVAYACALLASVKPSQYHCRILTYALQIPLPHIHESFIQC